jgi:hypothetical protein
MEKIPYRLKADTVEACSCRHGCNCQFGGTPNEGLCEMILGYDVRDGHFGNVSLKGLRAVIAGKYPNAIHEGHGHMVLFVDEKASPEQVDAFTTIVSGKMGGMPWEALAATVEKFEGPIRKSIQIDVAKEKSRVRVGDAIDLQLTPLKDPVTGEAKEVHIVYPKGGFFWNAAAIATTSKMHVQHGDFKIEWPDRYAAATEVNWSNQK